MKVLKFGGTSVGSATRMQGVVNLINDGETKVVVLSAMSGTTNALIEFTNYLRNGNPTGAIEHITGLQSKYPGVEFTVSGGISSMEDIVKLDALGLKKVIVGKAIYENKITLEEIRQWLQRG